MKVRVDAGVCAGFGVCLGLCPEVFELREVPQELEDAVRKAVSQCPARAISLSDEPR
jgi:ferredoxin